MKKWLQSFRPPLHVVVLAFMLACSAITLVVKLLVVDRWEEKNYANSQKAIAESQVARLGFILSSESDARNRVLEVQLLALQTQSQVPWAAVCDAEGKVLYSTKKEWEGHPLAEVAPARAVEAMNHAVSSQKPVTLTPEEEDIFTALAVPTPGEQPVQHVVLLQRDLLKGMERQKRHALRTTIDTMGMMVGYSLLLWFFIFLFLRWRMRDFYRSSDLALKYAAAAGEEKAPVGNGDEFTEIASAFGKAELLLQDIADSLHESIWIITPDMRTIYLSPAFETIHGHKREESYVNPPRMPDYILKEHHEQVSAAFASIVKGANALHLEYRIRRGDGEIRWLEVRGGAVRDKDGALQRIVGISRDITEQKLLQEELVSVSEQERHSLGHDLHDDACQRLAAMKMKSEALATRLKQEESPHSKLARELVEQISGTSALLRNIARGLAPVEVAGDGLMLALEKLVLMQEAIHEVPCFFRPETQVMVGSEIVATHLYRIVQEFIANAARHAKPERIEVRVEEVGDQVRFSVINDGPPFQKPTKTHHGMGLKIIHYRATAIRATINIQPREDGVPGTVAECTLSRETCLHGVSEGKPAVSKAKPDEGPVI